MTQLATLLKEAANTWMAARLARRVSEDVVRAAPYPAIGAALLVGAAVVLVARRRRTLRH